MNWVLHAFTMFALFAGAVFFLAGTVGLLRFPDTMTRLHALTKVDNLGLGLIVLALLPRTSDPLMALKLVSIWLLIQLSGAVVTQLLARAARPRSSHNRPSG
jgi:multicomponent Na+:H+ antiporter subunit G